MDIVNLTIWYLLKSSYCSPGRNAFELFFGSFLLIAIIPKPIPIPPPILITRPLQQPLPRSQDLP